MPRALIFVSVISLVLMLGFSGYGQEGSQEQELMTIQGRIVAIDWVASTIVVRWLPADQYKYDEISLFVPHNAIITSGIDTIGLSDLEITHKVSVEYYNASPGPLVVTRIITYL